MKDKIETCRRCGRKLKTEKSIKLGFGRVCYQKYLEEQARIGFMDNQMSMDEIAN